MKILFWLIKVPPVSRGYPLVWLLAFTESFASLVSHVIGLFTPWEKLRE